MKKEEKKTMFDDILLDPSLILFSVLLICVYYGLFSYLGIQTEEGNKNIIVILIEIVLWSSFIFLVLINSLLYIFNIDIIETIKKYLGISNVIFVPDVKKPIGLKKEVYHIPGNNYTYDEAQTICKSKGSTLATWKDLYNSYNKGGDWCSYGWSDGQMALFPTQYSKWSELQKNEGHENDCGRPGVNGGFIDNPAVKFGINCFGIKPTKKKIDQEYMEQLNIHPKSKEDKIKQDYWNSQKNNMVVAPFNKNSWNESYL